MGIPLKNGTFAELVKKLNGSPQAVRGSSEAGRARVRIEGRTVLLIIYDRSSDAHNRGYRGIRPDQTLCVRGVPSKECWELEQSLLRDERLKGLVGSY
jgi:hypothetical protein